MNLDNELWVAAALLHRRDGKNRALPVAEIRSELLRINPSRKGQEAVNTYLSDHCVANKKRRKHSIGARIFVDVGHGLRRLYKPGDPTDVSRLEGKYMPQRAELPAKFQPLLDWYETEYHPSSAVSAPKEPVVGDASATKGKDWLRFVGYINAHDLGVMKKAIEEDFEKVYPE